MHQRLFHNRGLEHSSSTGAVASLSRDGILGKWLDSAISDLIGALTYQLNRRWMVFRNAVLRASSLSASWHREMSGILPHTVIKCFLSKCNLASSHEENSVSESHNKPLFFYSLLQCWLCHNNAQLLTQGIRKKGCLPICYLPVTDTFLPSFLICISSWILFNPFLNIN